jgi:hypothetical protein
MRGCRRECRADLEYLGVGLVSDLDDSMARHPAKGTRCPATRNIPLSDVDLEQCQLPYGHPLDHVARGDGWITTWPNEEDR